jgi:hypothetical protein
MMAAFIRCLAMSKRLQIKLLDGWSDYSHENPEGPSTFLRESSEVPGPLQVSWAEYTGGAEPNPTASDLEEMSRESGDQQQFGQLVESTNGACDFGRFGTAVFRSTENPRVQIWHLSNGRDFIMVTHICPQAPDPAEVREAQEIVRSLTLCEQKSKWKFWR